MYELPVVPEYSLIIMDNHPMNHGMAGDTLSDILDLKNCAIEYLPAYCPDFNPIESFATIKYYLKNDPQLFLDDPMSSKVTERQLTNWYRLCGYQ